MKKILFITTLFLLLCPLFAEKNCYVLRDNAPLREDKGNNGVEWSTEVPAGTVLKLESETPVVTTLITKKESTPNLKFYKVTYNDKSYFVLASEVAIGGEPAVITENATLFSKPTISAFMNAQIETASYVIAGDTYSKNGMDFIEIKYWNESAWQVRTRYIRTGKISKNSEDIKAIQVLDKVNSLKDDEMKLVLLDSAMKLSTSRQIAELVEKTNNDLMGIFVNPTPENTTVVISEETVFIKGKNGVKIDVKEIPGKLTKVVGQLDSKAEVDVMRKTNDKDTIDGVQDYWYFVSNEDGSVEGWVFGAYVAYTIDAK